MKTFIHKVLYCAALLSFSSPSFAHIRWFVTEPQTSVYFTWSWLYYLIPVLAVAFGLISVYAEKYLTRFYATYAFFRIWPKVNQWRILMLACGVTFIHVSWMSIYIAPNIVIVDSLLWLIWLQAAFGVLLLSGVSFVTAGWVLLSLCAISMVTIPFRVWMDYGFEFAGVALGLLIFTKQPQTALLCLRVALGVQLAVLAVHNKLLNPALGVEFLQHYQWNFMQMMGISQFDDLLFVYAAGIAELTLGVLILIGMSTRVVVLCVSFFFCLTSVLMGVGELMGHIPILACALVLLTLGGGVSLTQWWAGVTQSASGSREKIAT